MALYDNPNATPPASVAPATTSPIIDPYTRGLVAQGVQQGTMYDIVSNVGYEAERTRREALLRESIVPAAQATLETGLRDVRGTMERGGKLASSAAVAAQMRTSELYGAQVAGEVAKGSLSLYETLGQERSQELNRLLASGTTSAELQTQMYGISTQQQIAQIQDYTNQKIAQLNADTSLTVEEKRVKIAQEQYASQERIAVIQATAQTTSARIAAAGAATVAGIQAESATNVANIQVTPEITSLTAQINPATGTFYTIEQAQAKIDQDKLESDSRIKTLLATINPATGALYTVEQAQAKIDQDTRVLNAQINPATGKFYSEERLTNELMSTIDPDTNKSYTAEAAGKLAAAQIDKKTGKFWSQISMEADIMSRINPLTNKAYSAEDAERITTASIDPATGRLWGFSIDMAKLEENTRQFNITTTEGTKQYWAKFAKDAKEFDITTAQQWDMFQYKMKQDWQTVNLQNDTTRETFWANFGLAKAQFENDAAYKDKLLAFENTKFLQGIAQWKVETEQDATEFWAQFNEAKSQFKITTEEQSKQYWAAFAQSAAQWKITTEEDSKRFWSNFDKAKSEFTATLNQQWQLAKAQIEESARQFDISSADGRAEFWANLGLGYDKLKQDSYTQQEMQKLAYAQLKEQGREFDISTDIGVKEFWANYNQAQTQIDFDQNYKTNMYDLAVQQFIDDSARFDLTRNDQIAQFAASLQANKDALRDQIASSEKLSADQILSNETIAAANRTLTRESFALQWKQFNVTTAIQYEQWAAGFQEQARQFNLSAMQQYEIAIATLSLDTKNSMTQNTLAILSNPFVLKMVDGETKDYEAKVKAINARKTGSRTEKDAEIKALTETSFGFLTGEGIEGLLTYIADGGSADPVKLKEFADLVYDMESGKPGAWVAPKLYTDFKQIQSVFGDGFFYGEAPVLKSNPWGISASDLPQAYKGDFSIVMKGEETPGYWAAYNRINTYMQNDKPPATTPATTPATISGGAVNVTAPAQPPSGGTGTIGTQTDLDRILSVG